MGKEKEMNSIDFCYWLQGYFELSDVKKIDTKQTKIVKDHLNLVFLHEIDPLRESESVASKEELDAAHTGSNVTPSVNNHLFGGNDPKARC